jgi:flagellar basal-body rod protein FlgF
MSSGIYVATAGAIAQSNALDATANNIANAGTAGFRADRVTFREALTAARSADVASVNNGATTIDARPGSLSSTENPLDLALEGDGMFAVTTPQGPRYTRAGNFRLDDDRKLVNGDGHAVRGDGGSTIVIPPDASSIQIGPDGTVRADDVAVGKLELVKFNANQLRREGGSLYAVPNGSAAQAGDPPKVRQGMLEVSNVNIVRGVVDLVKVSRTYESLMRVIQGYHDVESRAARELGGPK